jgi:hypothetical protein
MKRQEFYDKIDSIREMIGGSIAVHNSIWTHQIDMTEPMKMLDELKTDADMLANDEYERGLETGTNAALNDE